MSKTFPICLYVGLLLLKLEKCGSTMEYHLNNDTWFITKLHRFPTMYFELDFQATFPVQTCCPVIVISTHKLAYFKNKCYEVTFQLHDIWYKNAVFDLKIGKEEKSNIDCLLNATLGIVECNALRVVDQDYEPKQRHLYIGYPCNATKKMDQFTLKIDMRKESNKTTCERTEEYDFPGTKMKCNKYYNYTSLPNTFGDMTQRSAYRSMELFNLYFNKRGGKYCHTDLLRLVCMIFLPRCPSAYSNVTLHTMPQNIIVENLIPPCREMGHDVIDACAADLQPVMRMVQDALPYFPPQNGTVHCYSQKVQCGKPHMITNGRLTHQFPNNSQFFANDVVYYQCDENYELSSAKNYSMCTYSGFWTATPICQKITINYTEDYLTSDSDNALNKTSIVLIAVFGCVLVLTVLISIIRPWRIISMAFKSKGSTVTSRNRSYDAFVSYESGDSDEQFVRNEICPQLDSQYGGKFKLLIHQRDFHAGTLIMANIQNAVKDSNCAIILLSQAYMKSRWCQQEFEECMEESKRDENYKLIVILMQPIAELEQETFTPYMESFLRSRTYMKKSDSKLWTKLNDILVKHRTSDSVINDNDTETQL